MWCSAAPAEKESAGCEYEYDCLFHRVILILMCDVGRTFRVNDHAPLILGLQLKRRRGARCSPIVKPRRRHL